MKRTALSIVALLGLLLTPLMGAAAQPRVTDQQYTSAITGEVIDLGANIEITFMPDNFATNENDTFQEEFIWFTYNWSNFQIGFVQGPATASQYHEATVSNMNEFYDSFELIDEEIRRDGSWFLGQAESNGTPLVIYYEYQLDVFGDVDLLVMQFSDASTLTSDLEVVQSDVTIGGEPILPNTDLQMLNDLLGNVPEGTEASTPESGGGNTDGTSSRTTRTSRNAGTGGEASTPESGGGNTDGTTSRTTRTSRNAGTGGEASTPESNGGNTDGTTSRTTRTSRTSTTEGNTTETTGTTDRGSLNIPTGIDTTTTSSTPDATGSNSDAGDWESLGLISDSEWESPTFGTAISWDTVTWEFPRDYESAIYQSDDGTYDVITLQTTDGLGYVFLSVEEAGDGTPRDLMRYWTSPEYAETFSKKITVIDGSSTANTASVIYETTNARDQPLIVVVEASFLEDGTIVYSQISAAPETIHEVYGQVMDGIEANGAPLELTWTIEDIQDIVGN